MGLGVALSNALSGMRINESGIDVLSRNVANSGTPGYHRQSVTVIDGMGVNSTYARQGTVSRAFNQSLQAHYTRATSDSSFSSVRANVLDRLQTLIGMPGQTGSLDTSFSKLQTAISTMATSPDSYASRSDVVAQAQIFANTLNSLTNEVQNLRRETEAKMTTAADDLNQVLGALQKINTRLADTGIDLGSRAALLDQRDRLVEQVSSAIDLRVTYRPDGTVGLATRAGVGILDGKASSFEFLPAGGISATSLQGGQDGANDVGKLILRTPAGLTLDLVQQNVLRSGTLGALVELRDTTLVQAQDQLDELAASMAQAMSTVQTSGTPISNGASNGYEVDLAALRNGNDFVVNYRQNGIDKSVRFLRVDDTTKLPMDYTDARGNRVVGLDFTNGIPNVAAQVQDTLGTSLGVSHTTGSTLRIMDDGAAGMTDVMSLTTRHTVSGTQGAGLALSLFVDNGNADFTNSLDGMGQKRGFAGRISVNANVIADSKLLVQYQAGGSLGDDDRAAFMRDQLDSMQFAGGRPGASPNGAYRLAGNVSELISQVMDYQGNSAANATAANDADLLTLDTLERRIDAESGVDVDEEMARLMELQNAYAANARVISIVQELLDQLMAI